MEDKKEEIVSFLKKNIKESRVSHIFRVSEYARGLAKYYGLSEDKAEIAGLLHDCAKGIEDNFPNSLIESEEFKVLDLNNYPKLSHAAFAVILARDKFNIYDEDILNSIKFHTTSRQMASDLENIIFLADKLEPGRTYKERAKLEKAAFTSLALGTLETLNANIIYLIEENRTIHPLALESRNYLLKKLEGNIWEKLIL